MSEFRIFISSTFRDLSEERRLLQGVFQQLREKCRSRGHDLKVVDLRWGISEEEQRQGRTMEVCLQEVAHCQDVSSRPNFLVLLGDRYGWEPAPDRIEVEEFGELVGALDSGEGTHVERMYAVDENAIPAVRVLRRERLSGGAVDEDRLVGLLRKAVHIRSWDPDDRRRAKYDCSATHQEILRGVLDERVVSPESHVFVTIRGRDPEANSAAERMSELEHAMDLKLGTQNFYRYPSDPVNRQPEDSQAFADAVLAWYQRVLCEAMDEADGKDRGRQGDGESERHAEIARRKSRVFVGREEEADQILGTLTYNSTDSIKITGGGGSGKSAFMGKVVQGFLPEDPTSQPPTTDSSESTSYHGYSAPEEPARDNPAFFGVDRHKNEVEQEVDVIRETVREVLRLEAPIHEDLLCHRVSRRWGLKSYTTRTRSSMEPFLQDPSLVERDGNYCWSPGGSKLVMAPRGESDPWRDGLQVHSAEVRGALKLVLDRALSENKHSLKLKAVRADVKAMFGIKKGAHVIGKLLDESLEWAESLGWRSTATTITHDSSRGESRSRSRAARRRVVVRFVGETERSCTYVELIRSVMDELLPNSNDLATGMAPSDPRWIESWHQALKDAGAEEPMIIFLDGVDQLRGAPADAHALVPKQLPKGVSMVVSTIRESPRWLPRDSAWGQVITLPVFESVQAQLAFSSWLGDRGRCLNKTQAAQVLGKARNVEEGQALFIRLAAGFAERWESGTRVLDMEPSPQLDAEGAEETGQDLLEGGGTEDISSWNDVDGLLESELVRLDKLHTAGLASRVVSLTAASRRGLNEKELQGVLQELPGFWGSFVGEQHVDHQRALQSVSIVPDSVLLRLLADLQDVFLKEWNGYFQPAHRLVREHAFRDEARRIESASAIADYFQSDAEPWFLDQGDGQREMPNRRKVLELPHALEWAGRQAELVEECLASPDCLIAAAVARDLESVLDIPIPPEHERSEQAETYRRSLRNAPALLFPRPTADLAQSVIGCTSDQAAPKLAREYPKLTNLKGFEVLDVDVSAQRVLLGDGDNVQERDLKTGQIVNSEPGKRGLLLTGKEKGWLLLGHDESLAAADLDRSGVRECLVPAEAYHGAEDEPRQDLGAGRSLLVHKSDRGVRAREVRLHGVGPEAISLLPGHTMKIESTAWSRSCSALREETLTVASGGVDKHVRLYQVDERSGESRPLHEKKFENKVMHVLFAGEGDRLLLAFLLDDRSKGITYEHLHTYDLWALDLSTDAKKWEASWKLLRHEVRTWPLFESSSGPGSATEHLWIGAAEGVVELNLGQGGSERTLVAIEGVNRFAIWVVAPGVGCAVFEVSSVTEYAPGLEQHVIFRTDVAPVNIGAVEWCGVNQMGLHVLRLSGGALLCFEQRGGEKVVVRSAETLEVERTFKLPPPRDVAADGYELGADNWSLIERLSGGGFRLSNQSRSDGVYLDFDDDGKVVGQLPRLGSSMIEGMDLCGYAGGVCRPLYPMMTRSSGGEAIVFADGRTFLRQDGGKVTRLASIGPRSGSASHQRLVSGDSLIVVDNHALGSSDRIVWGGARRAQADGGYESLELTPRGIRKLVVSGSSTALIGREGSFWYRKAGAAAWTPWKGAGFACLDAEGVRGGGWVVSTMRSLVRISDAGDVSVLVTSDGPVVELLGANGEEVLCRIGQALYLVSTAQWRKLDCVDLPSGRPQLHSHESGVLLFEDSDEDTLTAWDQERGVLGCLEMKAWNRRTFLAFNSPSGCAVRGEQGPSYKCVPGGVVYEDPSGLYHEMALIGSGCDRSLDEDAFRSSDLTGSIIMIPESFAEEARVIGITRGGIAWLNERGLYTAAFTDEGIGTPSLRADGLADAYIEAAWSLDTFHIFEEHSGLCWSLDLEGGAEISKVPYRGRLFAGLVEGEVFVRHQSGLVKSGGEPWRARLEPINECVGFTLDGEHLVISEGKEFVVRSVTDDEVIARFRKPGGEDGVPWFTSELMIHVAAPGVFACTAPLTGSEEASVSDTDEEAVGTAPLEGEYNRILGVDPQTEVALCQVGAPNEEDFGFEEDADDDGSAIGSEVQEHALISPDGSSKVLQQPGTAIPRADGLPVFHDGRSLRALQADGAFKDLEVPEDWWSLYPSKMKVPGPGKRLKLGSGGKSMAFDWMSDPTESRPVHHPEGWECEGVFGVDQPILLERWVEVEETIVNERALYDPAGEALGEPLRGRWNFYLLTDGRLLGLKRTHPDDEANSSSKISYSLFTTDGHGGINLQQGCDFEVPEEIRSNLAFDRHRDCLWYMDKAYRLHCISADGAASSASASAAKGLKSTNRWHEEYLIQCLPDELLIRHEDSAASGEVCVFDPEKMQGRVVDFLPGRENESLTDVGVAPTGHYLLRIEDNSADMRRKEQHVFRAGMRKAGGAMTLGEVCWPWRKECAEAQEAHEGIATVERVGQSLRYRLLSWDDLTVLREATLPGSDPLDPLPRVCRGDAGFHLFGENWAAFIPDDEAEALQQQVWSPAGTGINGDESPQSFQATGGALRASFSGHGYAEWDPSGSLIGFGSTAAPVGGPAGMPLCSLRMVEDSLLVGCEGAQVRVLSGSTAGCLGLRSKAAEGGHHKKIWQIIALYPSEGGRVIAVYRYGVVELFEPDDGSLVYAWRPRSETGGINPLKDLAHVEARGRLYMRLDDNTLKVMDTKEGRVWKQGLGTSGCQGLEAFGQDCLAIERNDGSVDVVSCPESVGAVEALNPSASFASSCLVHAVSGKGWLSAVHTPEGMVLPDQSDPLPVVLDQKAEVVSSRDGAVWASLLRKKVKVVGRAGDMLQEWSVKGAAIAKKITVRPGSKLDHLPLAISPAGATVAVFLEGEGGSFMRAWRVADGEEQTIVDVQDAWFLDDERCVVVRTDGSLEEHSLWSCNNGEGVQKLAPPVRGLVTSLELPDAERTLMIYEDCARLFKGAAELPMKRLGLEPLEPGPDPIRKISLSTCGRFLAEGRQQGVVTIYRLEDGEELPLLAPGSPEWLAVKLVPGRVWGLTVEGRLWSHPWSPW